jgi:hypothetical protein
LHLLGKKNRIKAMGAKAVSIVIGAACTDGPTGNAVKITLALKLSCEVLAIVDTIDIFTLTADLKYLTHQFTVTRFR